MIFEKEIKVIDEAFSNLTEKETVKVSCAAIKYLNQSKEPKLNGRCKVAFDNMRGALDAYVEHIKTHSHG